MAALLRLGSSAAVELTGLRTPCVLLDRFQAGLKKQLIGGIEGPLYKCGVMGVASDDESAVQEARRYL